MYEIMALLQSNQKTLVTRIDPETQITFRNCVQ